MAIYKLSGKIIQSELRIAIAEALTTPCTGKEIIGRVQKQFSQINYHNLRHALRKLEKEQMVTCLNPESKNGRLYVLSSEKDNHFVSVPEIELHAKLRRAKTRMAVLEEIGRNRTFGIKPLTVSQIRKNLLVDYPLGLNHVIAAVKFLKAHFLVEVVGHTEVRDLRIYGLTELGKAVLAKMEKDKM